VTFLGVLRRVLISGGPWLVFVTPSLVFISGGVTSKELLTELRLNPDLSPFNVAGLLIIKPGV
jgi:hypothetical protein